MELLSRDSASLSKPRSTAVGGSEQPPAGIAVALVAPLLLFAPHMHGRRLRHCTNQSAQPVLRGEDACQKPSSGAVVKFL